MAASKKKKPPARSKWPTLAEALTEMREPKKLPPILVLKDLPELQANQVDVRESVLRAIVSGKLADEPMASLVREGITAESRDAFALALLHLWETKEFHGRYDWVLDAVMVLGGDQTLLALSNYMAAWPGQSDTGRKRAIRAIGILLAAGSDTAILALLGLRQTVVAPSVLEAVIDAIARAVKKRKTTLSELFDAITPTLGLDARGTRVFDYGGKQFVAAFDDHLQPHLRDETGATVEDLPTAEWATLSVDLREAVKVQTFRLEQDMIRGRRWEAARWTHLLKEHPLMVSFTRRLVWGIYDDADALVVAFRTAEDQSHLDRDGEEFKVPDSARIGLVHPLHFDDATRAIWATQLGDYEIIQPFPQLGRAVHKAADAERATKATMRFSSTKFKSGVLRDVLVRKGWERDPSLFREYYQRFFESDSIFAKATLDPGVSAGEASYEIADQTIPTVEFFLQTDKEMKALALEDVPFVVFSEAIVDLADVLAEQDA